MKINHTKDIKRITSVTFLFEEEESFLIATEMISLIRGNKGNWGLQDVESWLGSLIVDMINTSQIKEEL